MDLWINLNYNDRKSMCMLSYFTILHRTDSLIITLKGVILHTFCVESLNPIVKTFEKERI